MRGVALDAAGTNERALFFFQQLCALGYTQEQMDNARKWIMFGDWTFKGKSPTVEFADFFPTEAQLRSTASACGFIVLSSQEWQANRQKVAIQARQDAIMEFERQYKPVPLSETERELNEMLKKMMQEKNELRLQNQQLINEVAMLRAKLADKRIEEKKKQEELIEEVKKRRAEFRAANDVLQQMKVA